MALPSSFILSIINTENDMNRLTNKIGLLIWSLCTVLFLGTGAATASTVQFSQGSSIYVGPGEIFTLNLVGENFASRPDGAAFSLVWDPAVLSYQGITVANPPWDTQAIGDSNVASGHLDFVFLGKTSGSVGNNPGTNYFDLAAFSFKAIGNIGNISTLAVALDSFNTGFVAPGAQTIPVTFVNSQVQVVPVPTAAWLFGSAFTGLIGFARRKSA